MSESAETINFKITLSGTYWSDRRPEFDILIDDQIIHSDAIKNISSRKGLANSYLPQLREQASYQTIEHTCLLEPGEHVLGIRFKNKKQSDTQGFNPDGTWNNDVLLNVEKIVIDGVDLHNILYQESCYELDQPQLLDGVETTTMHHVINLGFNGTWKLPFTSPFYIWLLERL